MTYVIAGSCIKDDSCIEVCPVDCIHPKPGAPDFETAEQLYIDPEVCIDCDACVEACPVDAIFPDFEVPEKYDYALELNAEFFAEPGHRRAHRGVMARARPRVAIVGAGPRRRVRRRPRCCGRDGDAEIDLFERLPTPWGLLRGGVAPDHQEIKRLEDTFDRQTLRRGCRFLGNVEVGVDVSARRAHAPLRRRRLRDRRADRQVARDPRRGPARQLGRRPSSSPGTTATPTTATSSSTSRASAPS